MAFVSNALYVIRYALAASLHTVTAELLGQRIKTSVHTSNIVELDLVIGIARCSIDRRLVVKVIKVDQGDERLRLCLGGRVINFIAHIFLPSLGG
jgi:hypothetical protein